MHHRQTVLDVTVAASVVVGDSKNSMRPGLSSCVDFIGGRVADRTNGELEIALSCPSDLTIRDIAEFGNHFRARVWLGGHEVGRVAFVLSVCQAVNGFGGVSTCSLLYPGAAILTLVIIGLG